MQVADTERFPPHVSERLKCYVYPLIDPRNGETFYVGRGRGDRVFAPMRQRLRQEEGDLKLGTIAAIRREGLAPIHVIHRHGLDEETAVEVEAALIDAYPFSANARLGDYSGERGTMRAEQIIRRLSEEPFSLAHGHKLLLVKIGRSHGEADIYTAARAAWRLNVKKARECDYVLALAKGLVAGVFVAREWKPALVEDFPFLTENAEGRWAFVGHEAPPDIQVLYRDKVLPAELTPIKGAANPIRYSW